MRRARIALRAAADADRAFLRDLFATTRADELAALPWPDAAKTQFVDNQFALQHDHFLTHHGGGDFLVVTRRDAPVGRLYLDRGTVVWRVLEITLSPAARGAGVGTLLLCWLQDHARAAGAGGIDLHVLATNSRAARLYAALGFVEAIAASPTHRRMVWSPPVS